MKTPDSELSGPDWVPTILWGIRNLSMEIGHMVSKFKVYSGWQRLSFWV
jgi:hypothetical protein